MTLVEYRKNHGMKQEDVVEMLKPSLPWLTRPLYSLYERGLIESKEITACIQSVFGLESDLTAAVDKCITEKGKPLKNDYRAFETYIALSRANEPLTRGQLVRITGLSDREVRRQINELRKGGVRVASSSTTSGYWICVDDDDYRRLRAELYSRIADMSKMVRAMDMNYPGQIRMGE